jgi:hypothetical protein
VSSAIRNVVLLYDERLDFPGLAAIDADLVRTLTSNPADAGAIARPGACLALAPERIAAFAVAR